MKMIVSSSPKAKFFYLSLVHLKDFLCLLFSVCQEKGKNHVTPYMNLGTLWGLVTSRLETIGIAHPVVTISLA